MHSVWSQGDHHHLQYKPLLPAHAASQDRCNLHQVRAQQTEQASGNEPLYWLAVQSGVAKISEYLSLNMRAESYQACREGEQQ